MPGAATTRAATAAVADQLLAWFDREARDWPWRRSRDRWVVLVSEVCLQQTQVQRAAPYVERVLDRFPTPADLAVAPLTELLTLWQGLGYPRRARNLWLAAQHVTERGWPGDYRTLPGVGEYTDQALRCFADEQAVVPLDVNTRRVLRRLFPDGAPQVADEPGIGAWRWGQALMELGQRVCTARAVCAECPVRQSCPSAGTTVVIASPRQRRYKGSMRHRRGDLLRSLLADHQVPLDRDEDAARELVADGLAALSACGTLLVPVEHA